MEGCSVLVIESWIFNMCKHCRRIINQGNFHIRVFTTSQLQYYLGVPEDLQPSCCGERKNGFAAIFATEEDAFGVLRTYQEKYDHAVERGESDLDLSELMPLVQAEEIMSVRFSKVLQ